MLGNPMSDDIDISDLAVLFTSMKVLPDQKGSASFTAMYFGL
jgi:hypothetical protein